MNALLAAVQEGYEDIVTLLLAHHANVQSRSRKVTTYTFYFTFKGCNEVSLNSTIQH